MSTFLWVVLPYAVILVFVGGHLWRRRWDQIGWTTRSSQLLESRWLSIGSPLFHFGLLGVIGGHVLGILIPRGVTNAVGIHEHLYHRISVVAGGLAGVAMTVGFAILLYRRAAVPRVRVTTSRGDLVMYPLLTIAIVTGMIATFGGNLVSPYHYRETVSPWFRGIFTFQPHTEEMAGAPFLFQLHATSVWLLYAVWPFSRLVHAWSIPLSYLQRSWILYRGRNPRASLAFERSRVAEDRAQP